MSKKKTKDWQKIKDECEQAELKATSAHSDEDIEYRKTLDFPDRETLESQLLAAEKKAEDSLDKAIRAEAEMRNVMQRAEREIANAHRYGVEKLIKELIPVIDSLDQAMLVVDQQHHQDMVKGMELTMKLLLSAFEKFEVKQLNPAGKPFDPQEHEAMSMQETDEVKPNTVVTVFQKGYKLSDRVIRPARVIVSKTTA